VMSKNDTTIDNEILLLISTQQLNLLSSPGDLPSRRIPVHKGHN
jgi:hypothetical protein